MKRLFILLTPFLLAACGTLNTEKLLSAGVNLATSYSITDAQVASMCAEYMTYQDEQSVIAAADSPYTTRLNKLTSGIKSTDGLKLNFKVYQSEEINAFACGDGSIRVYSGLMDAMTDEESLVKLESELEDRFGKMPQAAKELMNAVRLRWEAMRLGMERVKVKNGLMIVHFVGEQNSPYYKSDIFMDMLRKITAQPDRFVLKQHNNRLAMTVRRVSNVAEAVTVLRNL